MTCLGGSSYGPLLTTTLMLAPGRLSEFLKVSEKKRIVARGNDSFEGRRCHSAVADLGYHASAR